MLIDTIKDNFPVATGRSACKMICEGYTTHNMHRCRCKKEEVPGNVIIDKDEEELKAVIDRLYIKTRILLKLGGYNY